MRFSRFFHNAESITYLLSITYRSPTPPASTNLTWPRPKETREKLGVHSGVRKAAPFDLAWHRALSPTLVEGDSTNDHKDFDDL